MPINRPKRGSGGPSTARTRFQYCSACSGVRALDSESGFGPPYARSGCRLYVCRLGPGPVSEYCGFQLEAAFEGPAGGCGWLDGPGWPGVSDMTGDLPLIKSSAKRSK